MGTLEDLGQAIAAVADRAGGSVVGLGRGSGVVLAPGRVLTNAHNLRGDTSTVVLPDGREVTGRLLGMDVDGDLAVIEADTGGLPPVAWADDRAVTVGTPVVALSAARGRTRATVGFVSAVERAFRGPRGRRIPGGIEHTAPMARGSSGGPLLDTDGALLGLNTHRMGDGFYLAQPADAGFRARVAALGEGEAPRRRRLGVGLAPPRMARDLRRAVGLPDRLGLLVRVVEEESPADGAGIEPGDLIVAVGDSAAESADVLHAALDALPDGAALQLAVVRGTDERTVEVAFPDPMGGS